MGRYLLQKVLENIIGSPNVYYQPPANIKLKFPCIIYRKSKIKTMRADNRFYGYTDQYTLTYISKTVDDEVILKILELEMCTHDRRYTSDNLYHDAFTLYF